MKIRKSSGFGLIELIVVMAILGVVFAVALPTFTKYRDNANLREAARDISSDIQFYKQHAISENVRYRITFNSGTNNYVIQKESVLNLDDFSNVATKQVGAGNSVISILGTPSFSGGVPTITFAPRGTSTMGSLSLQHTKRLSTATITANLMGRTHVDYVFK